MLFTFGPRESEIRIALSESMTSNDPLAPDLQASWTNNQEHKSLGLCMTSNSPNLHFKKDLV